jgi:hypothetical protein
MALTYDQMNAVTEKLHVKKITQQAYDSNILLQKLAKGKRVKVVTGGRTIYHPIRHVALGTGAFIDPDSQKVVELVETRTALELNWCYLVTDMVMSWDEKVKNRGIPQIVSLMGDKVTESKQEINEKWSTALYQIQTAKATEDIDGLLQICQATGSATTYAGISSTDASNWVAGVYDNSTSAMALFGSGSLEAGVRACTFIDPPNLIITTRANAGIYASKLQPSERRVPGNGESGATELAFMGIPIIADPQCLANDVYYLNTNHLWLYVQKGENFAPAGWKEDPDHYFADINTIRWVGNLVCDLRKSQGTSSALSS